ncbi:MAG: XdhC family protein, partial [Candidatus Marinimicrobia bacterium]|nr:XdhC family protein [Candidatus Neomarinimicrobiota bacterium]
MKFNWIHRAAELEKKGVPFAIATVIDTVAPSSAKPTAKAIITIDGKMEGWIGGGCAQETVIEEALHCLNTGMASIIRLSPEQSSDGNVSYKKEIFLTCASGGTLEFHIEPVLPMTKLVIYGNTPTVSALSKMGQLLGYEVYALAPGIFELDLPYGVKKMEEFSIIEGQCVAVVATQGNGDLKALKAATASKPEFLSLIASKKKTNTLLEQLKKDGISKEIIDSIKFPAGLDIGAITPQEIAVSILAELIKQKRTATQREEIIFKVEDTKNGKEQDPICGMLV